MAIPTAVLAGLKVAGAMAPGVIKALQNQGDAPQQKVSSDTTAYLNRLRQISKEGLYGQKEKNEVASDIEASGDKREAKLRNLAVAQGIENSGVVGQQILQSGDMTTLALARTAKKLEEMNAQSKLTAQANASAVGQSIEAINYQNALANKLREDNRIAGIGEAIGAGISLGSSGNLSGLTDEEFKFLYGQIQ